MTAKKGWVEHLSLISVYIGALALAVLTALLTAEVILRYIFHTSTLISEEMSGYLFVAMLYLAMADTLRAGKHIKITVLTDRLRPGTQRLLTRLVAVLLPLVGVILSWQAWVLVLESYQRHSISPTILRTPQYLPQLAIPVGLTIFALQSLFQAFRTRKTMIPKPSPEETQMVDGA